MPSIQRPLSGDVMVLRLEHERERAADPATLEKHGRCARTLLKDGPLRVTLVVLAAGGRLAEHSAEGPITIQPLDGVIRFTARDETTEARQGDLLTAGAGVPHTVTSEAGAVFLLTVAQPGTASEQGQE